MFPEYRLNNEILAPRIEHRLDQGSWEDVLDFAKDLSDKENSFIPEISSYIDLSIFSSREFARSYRESPINSKVRLTDSDFHLAWYSNDMSKIPGFDSTSIAEIEDITINKVDDKLLLGLKLESWQLKYNRKAAINSNKRLTRVNLDWKLSDLVFGWVRVEEHNSLKMARQVRDIGKLLLEDNDFNLQFMPGIVDNHIIKLHD